MKTFQVVLLSAMFSLSLLSPASAAEKAKNLPPSLNYYCPIKQSTAEPYTLGTKPGADFLKGLHEDAQNAAGKALDPGVDLNNEEGLTSLAFKNSTSITPYLGARVASTDEAKNQGLASPASVPEESQVYAYQFGAGIGCDLDPLTKLSLGYRYSTGSDPALEDPYKINSDPVDEGHNISLGIKLGF